MCAPRYKYFFSKFEVIEPVGTCFYAENGFTKIEEYASCKQERGFLCPSFLFRLFQLPDMAAIVSATESADSREPFPTNRTKATRESLSVPLVCGTGRGPSSASH